MSGAILRAALFAALAAALPACSEDSGGEENSGGSGGGAGGGAGGGVVEQDVELEAPERGFQKEIPAFDVPAGTEVQDCYFFKVPPADPAQPDKPRWINRFHVRQNPGTHHMNVFRVKTRLELDGEDGDVVRGDTPMSPCWKSSNWADWPLVVNSQESSSNDEVDWTLPEGVATKLMPGELLMLQTHYVNAETQKTTLAHGKVIVNFHEVDEADVRDELGTLFTTNQQLEICPGETKSFSKTCNFAKDQPVHIVAANGHFHSRGKKFTAFTFDPTTGMTGDKFYESDRWDDPPMTRDIDVEIPTNAGVSYTCEFEVPEESCGDPMNECCFTFGGHVETQEHCNIFLYYYPKIVDGGCF